MKKIGLLTIFIAIFIFPLTAQVIYVAKGGNGNGSSWEEATGNLKKALDKAKYGEQIWIAEGIYYPTEGTDRTVSFTVKDGITLYGGFTGNEKHLNDRNFTTHKTILSGAIGSISEADNSYNVVYTENVSSNTIIDGVIITEGNADAMNDAGSRKRSGGGWFNRGSQGQISNPIIQNCIFTANVAIDGGAFYNNATGGEGQPEFTNCLFEYNVAYLDGGAIFNDGMNKGVSNPSFYDCRFENNEANYGGAVFNCGLAGESSPLMVNCGFISNKATASGGGIFNLSVAGKSNPKLSYCHFKSNTATEKGSSICNYSKGGIYRPVYTNTGVQAKTVSYHQ